MHLLVIWFYFISLSFSYCLETYTLAVCDLQFEIDLNDDWQQIENKINAEHKKERTKQNWENGTLSIQWFMQKNNNNNGKESN